MLNEKVINIISHARKNPRDKDCLRALKKLSDLRRNMMHRLRDRDQNTYSYILNYYGIKDMGDSYPDFPIPEKYLRRKLPHKYRHHHGMIR